jgi:hypothetical protein
MQDRQMEGLNKEKTQDRKEQMKMSQLETISGVIDRHMFCFSVMFWKEAIHCHPSIHTNNLPSYVRGCR